MNRIIKAINSGDSESTIKSMIALYASAKSAEYNSDTVIQYNILALKHRDLEVKVRDLQKTVRIEKKKVREYKAEEKELLDELSYLREWVEQFAPKTHDKSDFSGLTFSCIEDVGK